MTKDDGTVFIHKHYAQLLVTNPTAAQKYKERCRKYRGTQAEDGVVKMNPEPKTELEKKEQLVKMLRANGVKAFATWSMDKLIEWETKVLNNEVAVTN